MEEYYTVHHCHDDTSNCNGYADSCTKYKEYIKLAKEQGMKAIAFSNHGGIYDWIKKKQDCDKAGIKYIHGIELYLCRKLEDDDRGGHIGLYAKNFDGVLELNELISIAGSKGVMEDNSDRHMYHNPRISLNELMNTSDNIIVTTACLASPLNKWSINNDEESKLALIELIDWLQKNKHRCFLEIQHHNCKAQTEYNKYLLKLSRERGIPLIAGTDTHSSSKYKAECRKIYQIYKKDYYSDGDELDLVWKTYDELIEAFKRQNVLDEQVYLEAIENTNVLADMVEEFKLDESFKYPTLYGDNVKEQWKNLINSKFNEKLELGALNLSSKIISTYENYMKSGLPIDENPISEDTYRAALTTPNSESIKKYHLRIVEEFKIMCKLGMESFMMFMSELADWCEKNDIPRGAGRGSVCGSMIAYITDITDVDPLLWNTVFSRFCNEDRVSLADIDVDYASEDREKVYKYIINRFTPKKTAYIASFGTLQDRGCIDVLAGGLGYKDLNKVKEIKNEFEELYSSYSKVIQEEVNIEDLMEDKIIDSSTIAFDNNDIYLSRISKQDVKNKINKLKHEYDILIEANQDLFYYLEGLKGTIVSKGVHPSGIIGSPITLADNVGLFYRKGDLNTPVSMCAMKSIDSLNYVKFDILGLKTVGIIKDACKYIGIPYPKSHKVNWGDRNVWNNMVTSQQGVFQFEGDYAFSLLKDFKPTTINHMSMVNAALRPSGKSYRDRLISGEFNNNPSGEINNLLKDNRGFLIFQEDTIKFLTDICDFSGSSADTTRRCIDGNSLITLGNGNFKKIKDIKEGENVISVNKHGVSESKTVLNVFNNGVKNVYKVTTIHGKELIATENHKVYTQDGYKEVKDLTLDDSIMSVYYIPLRVKSIEYAGKTNVYDIEVEDNHNYIANGLVVHNCIGKKDMDGLKEQLPKILKGYCNHSPKDKDVAEEEAKQFVQIISDSSEYQFGYNHSTAYSMNGYECVALRTYYTIEFIAAYLNRAENKEDINNGVDLARQYDIEIKPIQFGKSLSDYTIDKENNTIYKGIRSIKYCNDIIANELLSLANNNTYKSFIELLDDINNKTSVNARQLKILTILNFFSMFGRNKYLLNIINVYNDFRNCKQINKSKLDKLNLSVDVIEKYSDKETKSLYKEINNIGLIHELCNNIENKSLLIKEQIKYEMEYLEYIVYTNPKAPKDMYYVVETKFYKDKSKPYLLLYNLKTGDTLKTKITQGKRFIENPFKSGNVLNITEVKEKNKMKVINGKWTKTDEIEKVVSLWEVY